MALTRQAYAEANTETFAADLKSALEAVGIFDSVTRSTLAITCAKNSKNVLILDCGASAGSIPLITANNKYETKLIELMLGTGGLNSVASISTDGASFVFCIFTNSYPTGTFVRSASVYVGKTKNGEIGIAVSYRSASSDYYPPTNTMLMTTESLALDTGVAFFPPKSTSYGYVSAYNLTAVTPDASLDTFESAYGVICIPAVFTCSRTTMGVIPAVVDIGQKSYLTDGCILIDLSAQPET